MIRFCLLLFLAAGAVLSAQAQESRIGFKAGPSISWMKHRDGRPSIPETYETTTRTGWHAGITYDRHFGPKLAVQAELLYAQQRERYSGTDAAVPGSAANPFTFEGNMRVEYAALPLLIKWYPLPRLALQAGPQISCLVRARYEEERGLALGPRQAETRVDDGYLRRAEAAAVAGLAYESELGLSLSVRYTHGLTEISKYSYPNNPYTSQNRGLQLAAGYTF